MQTIAVSRTSLNKAESLFALTSLLFYLEPLPAFLETIGASMLISPIRYAIVLISVSVFWTDWAGVHKALTRDRWIWPIVVMVLLSFVWSASPALTILELRSEFIPVSLLGIYLAVKFNRHQLLQLIYATALVSLVVSLFYVVFVPSIGKHPMLPDEPFPGAWKGLFSQKNEFGYNLTLLIVLTYVKLRLGPAARRLQHLMLLAVLAALTPFSQSLSALIISAATVFLLWLYSQFRWRGRSTVLLLDLLLMVAIGATTAMIVFWHPLISALGKDPTMSGRTLIWEYVIHHKVVNQPLVGYGLGVFWQVSDLFSGVYAVAHHVPAHSHNGYVEILADLGYVGLLLFGLSLVSLLSRVLVLAYRAVRPGDLWPLAFMIVFLISNITESVLLRGAAFNWLIYLTLYCSDLKKSSVP